MLNLMFKLRRFCPVDVPGLVLFVGISFDIDEICMP